MADDDIKPRPSGTIEVGPVTTVVTSVPDEIPLPKFLTDRDIFFKPDGTPRDPQPAGVVANFAPDPKGKDPSTVELKQVTLFNVNFCGKTFAEETYDKHEDFGRGAKLETLKRVGVGRTLAQKLLLAQEEIYREFVRELARNNQKPQTDDTKARTEFDAWCGIRAANGGWGFRNGPHSGGSAIDLNVVGCPYVATGKLGTDPPIVGGEVTSSTPENKKAALLARFRDALDVYDRAVKLARGDGETFDLSPRAKGEDAVSLYLRFERVHIALIQYFTYAYDSRNPKTLAPKSLAPGELHSPVSLDEFVARVSTDFDTEPADPNSFASTHPSFQAGMAGDRTAFLTPIYERIKADHEALRFVMIHGTMKFKPVGDGTLTCDISGLATRDPCFGFLDLRREIVAALMNVGLRWGAAEFSALANGDIMHFDLGAKVNPDLVPDPNPEKLGYKKLR